jgi:VWFA-related protein
MSRILLFIAAGFGFLAAFPLLSQTSSGQAPTGPVIHTTTREVVLDLVVRDKHRHPVTDLRPEEVEVYEDGVRQDVRVFQEVGGKEQLANERNSAIKESTTSASAAEHPAAALNSMRQVNFVSVVFADIAPLNLEFARRAVQEFLKSDTLPNTYVTIYRLDQHLGVIQSYTSDKELLAKAVDQAATGLHAQLGTGPSSVVSSSIVATLQAQAENILASPTTGLATTQAVQNELNNPLAAISKDPLFTANAASQDVSVTLGTAILTQALLAKGLRFMTNLSDGMNSMDALRALINSEEKLPGRKIVLYLADGLQLPMNRHEVVSDLISYANRAGVSFYTVDTRGLNVDDPMADALAAQKRTGAESTLAVTDPHTQIFEEDDVQLTAVASKQLAMRELAEATGGFAVTNTNEIALPMQRMMEDIRTHYEMAYAPTSTLYDGHFRKIEVKVNRPKVTVQTRRGYYAVPDLNGEPLQPYELLALNAMNKQPSEQVFPYEFAAMKFRPQQQAVEYEVTFEVPLSGLKPASDAKTGNAHFQAGLVAFIHDSSGEVVGKVSRELARDVPASTLSQLGNDRILYAQPVQLAPGHYIIDTAVTDEPSGKTSVKRVSLFVNPAKDLSLSSLQLVRRFEPLNGPRNPLSPFELENGRITPTLTDSVAAGPVSLYFVVYPSKPGDASAMNVTLELLRDGKEIARKPLNLASADVDGSIPMLVQLSPDPGQCDVLVTAKQGTAVAQSSLSVRIQ